MPKTWKLKSIPPHDFFICLDVGEYFDHEHNPDEIFKKGFTRPLPVGDQDYLVTIHFNGDTENPEFTIQCNDNLTDHEISLANQSLSRILGTNLDLRPLYEQAENDPVLGSLLQEFYGLKRISRANIFEDSVNRIIQTQIKHKPTARKMVYGIREAYGKLLVGNGKSIAAWPRPINLISGDPVNMKKYGLSLRKGEYLVGLANEFVSGVIGMEELEQMPGYQFYETMTSVRGIGPTTAQDLMLYRNRPDAVFPSNKQKGQEMSLRRWIIYSYGGDPVQTTEEEFLEMIKNWKGFEACALEFLFVNYVMNEKKKQLNKK